MICARKSIRLETSSNRPQLLSQLALCSLAFGWQPLRQIRTMMSCFNSSYAYYNMSCGWMKSKTDSKSGVCQEIQNSELQFLSLLSVLCYWKIWNTLYYFMWTWSQVFLLYSIATVYLKWWIIIINYRSTLLHIVNFNDTCLREATIMWSQFSRLMSIFCWNGICSKSVKTFCHCIPHISVWWFNVWSIPFIENDNDSIYHLSKHWVWQEKKTGPPRYISGGSFSTQVKCIRWH